MVKRYATGGAEWAGKVIVRITPLRQYVVPFSEYQELGMERLHAKWSRFYEEERRAGSIG